MRLAKAARSLGNVSLMRRIAFEGCYNFRDLGGWRTTDGRAVRSGRLFRADSVHLMTAEDCARARDELGLRTLLDLRNELEIDATGVGLLADGGLSRRHLPLTSRDRAAVDSAVRPAPSADRSPDRMVAEYLGILESSSDLIVGAVSALASDGALPAVFFCAAGKDRTGVLSAVVLGALGVRDEDVVADYVLTNDSITQIIERFAQNPAAPSMYREFPPTHFAPYAETMERVLAEVGRAYGSFAGYLVAKGLPEVTLDTLGAELLAAEDG